jgi:flagellar basal-body rod modification protein FlgD
MATNAINDSFAPRTFENTSDVQGVGKASLDQADFLTLMTAQIKVQDPFQPMDQAAFMGQITQFGMVDSQQKMNKEFSRVASLLSSNEVLQSVPLLQRDVLVSTDAAYLDTDAPIQGVALLDSGATDVRITIEDENGVLVRQESFGTQPAGELPFWWGGENQQGEVMPPGNYKIKVQATQGNETRAVETLVAARVTGVLPSTTTDPMYLQLRGMDPIKLDQVKKVM